MLIFPDLPEEILIDIFSRLPAKSAGKCRCLSKQWRTQLSTPQFAKAHFLRTRKTHQKHSLILTAPSRSLLRYVSFESSHNWSGAARFRSDLVLLVNHAGQIAGSIPEVKNDAVSRKLRLPGNRKHVVGSCDGLVLLANKEEDKFLLNPITQEMVKLPHLPPLAFDSMYVIGYDSATDDYKVVALSYYETDDDDREQMVCVVDVYSVKSGVWRRAQSSPFEHANAIPCRGIFVGGAIHWLACCEGRGNRSVIAAFNLADEVFYEIPAPKDAGDRFVSNELTVLGGRLCVFGCERIRSTMRVWVMNEYGVVESWTKFRIGGDCARSLVKPLCFIGDGDEEIVFVTRRKRLVVYNLKEGNVRRVVVGGVRGKFSDGVAFEESLISPSFKGQNVNVV